MSTLDSFRLSPAGLAILRSRAAAFGTQQQLADAAGLPKPTLQKLLSGDADPSFSRVAALAKALRLSLDEIANAKEGIGMEISIADAIAKAAGPSISEILNADIERRVEYLSDIFANQPVSIREAIFAELKQQHHGGMNVSVVGFSDDEPDMLKVPALPVAASAGDGSIASAEALRDGPFKFSKSWLRRAFGSTRDLRLVQVKGASQEPDLHDGDWVLIDQGKTEAETGLAVLRLDDCVMIKWLEREGRKLHLMSRNPRYGITTIDLGVDEERLQIIGRAVFCLKSL